MRIVSIVGARPQFIKVATICRAVEKRPGIEHRLIHTGQHYDSGMSGVFFEELGIPAPDYHLGVGSGAHAAQTAEMMRSLDPLLGELRPDWVVIYGDTNSTAAGALAAMRRETRLAHVEAGLRSFNRAMPEEINRVVADHVSDLLLCPTAAAMDNLSREGLGARAQLTGDVMYDAVLAFRRRAETTALEVALPAGTFALATVHRAENTDRPDRLKAILRALDTVARTVCPVVLPLHPRTRKTFQDLGLFPEAVTVIPPAAYLQMLLLESRAAFILTDSGGVQKEAYFFQRPCVTLRDETEWVETLENGCNVLAGADCERIVAAAAAAREAGPWTAAYGNGEAAERILDALSAR
jgi:UDP-GlcNAc3NAcA epimerase